MFWPESPLAGIRLHLGKTKVWNKGGVEPEHIHTMGENAWQPSGIMVLGTPIGSEQFVREKLQDRIIKERRLWQAIPNVPDLQCGWQILLQSANPRAHHTLRTLPPAMSAEYVLAHDEGLWETARALLGEIPHEDAPRVRDIATLPMRMGGFGLRSAVRCAHAVYWASWVDALHMVGMRNPTVADAVVKSMSSHEEPVEECFGELQIGLTAKDSGGDPGGPIFELEVGQRRMQKVKKRATPIEHTVARIFREAGATVRKNVFFKDMNVEVGAEDARQIEVLAQELLCFGGAELAIDVTLRCVLSCEGEVHTTHTQQTQMERCC